MSIINDDDDDLLQFSFLGPDGLLKQTDLSFDLDQLSLVPGYYPFDIIHIIHLILSILSIGQFHSFLCALFLLFFCQLDLNQVLHLLCFPLLNAGYILDCQNYLLFPDDVFYVYGLIGL